MRQIRWTARIALWLCVFALSWNWESVIFAIALPGKEVFETENSVLAVSEAEKPKAEEPRTGEPEAGEPETGEPEAGEPEAGEPETGEPETGEPETGEPEAGEPEAGEPETGEPEAGEPETGEPEAGEPETGEPETGEPETEKPEEETPQVDSYEVQLETCRIEEGEVQSYTTISSAYAGNSEMEGYYPGKLTVSVEGQIIIEAGGMLSIGTLSLGGPEESPILSGSGQIIVKAGGSLRLTDVVFADDVEGPMIIQEPGGSVLFQWTEGDDMVQWSSPLVNNLYDNPDDLWLEAGTVLTPEMLPTVMEANIQNQGAEESQEVALSWDLSGYNGQTDGTWKINGVFLDENGQTIQSIRPLEMTIHWYTPDTLSVISAAWKGESVPTVQLVVKDLPEFADVWGEVSEDDGETWTIWSGEELFFLVEHEPEGDACIFVLPDETPRLFRIAAEDPIEHYYWQSEAFYLYPEEQEDSGGNRGGSITPITPSRKPSLVLPETEMPQTETQLEPETELAEDEPSVPADATQTEDEQPVESEKQAVSEPIATEAAPSQTAGASEPRDKPAEAAILEPSQPEQSTDSLPVSEPIDVPLSDEAGTALAGSEQPEEQTALPTAVQVLMVVAGAAACAAIALAVAGIGPFRRRK